MRFRLLTGFRSICSKSTYLKSTCLFSATLLLTGCVLDNDSDTPSSRITTIHAVSDAPRVNVQAANLPSIEGADYKEAGQFDLPVGRRSVTVDAILPGGETINVINASDLSIQEGFSYDVIAVGLVGESSVDAFVLSDDGQRDAADSARVRVAHLSARAPEVSVYVTAPAADLTGTDPLVTFAFPDATAPVEVPAGDYQIRITAAGADATDDNNILFDSGPVPLPVGADLLIGAVDNTATGDSPVSLIVENNGSISEIFDVDSGALIRVVHNSYNAPNVDVYASEINGAPAISDLAFPNVAPSLPVTYLSLPADEYEFSVTATGDLNSVVSATLDLANGSSSTVLASGPLEEIQLLPYTDDNRRVVTAARVRFIHGAAEAPNVDVYLVEQGAGIGNSTPVLTDIPYEASSGYLDVASGAYDIIVTAAGTGTVAIGPVSVDFSTASVYTYVAREAVDFVNNQAFDITALDAGADM